MSKPIVAVVGRPNVGKSTLFNSLCGQQISIVKDTPGVTRDRIYAEVSWLNHNFTLIDTGGIEPDTGDIILSQMREQAEIAIETADIIIFMTDVKQGLVDSDSKVADMLRRSHKPVILVVNKVDSFEKMMPDVYEFYNLGIGEPFPISAVNKLGFGEVLDEVVSHFPEGSDTDEEDDRPKVAIIGKPNVGKSSLLNCLLKEKRAIVTDIPGTTRDIIEEFISLDGIPVKITDTAGIRETEDEVEKIGVEKSREKIDEADLVVLMLDSSRPLEDEDREIIKKVKDKKYVVLMNKNDLEKKISDDDIKELKNIIYISAKTGFGIDELKKKVKDLFFNGEVDSESMIISNNRHKQALYRALENCEEALDRVKSNEYLDLISIYVTSALKALGEITGSELEEDLINKIFSEFCVGK